MRLSLLLLGSVQPVVGSGLPATTPVFVAGEEGYNSFRIPGIVSGNCSSSSVVGEVLMLCAEGRKFVRHMHACGAVRLLPQISRCVVDTHVPTGVRRL